MLSFHNNLINLLSAFDFKAQSSYGSHHHFQLLHPLMNLVYRKTYEAYLNSHNLVEQTQIPFTMQWLQKKGLGRIFHFWHA